MFYCSCEVYIRLGGLEPVYKPWYIKENRLDHVINLIRFFIKVTFELNTLCGWCYI